MRSSQTRRTYASPLREDQASATRTRILDALLARYAAGQHDLSIPALSRFAGVSIPTIYRHFPTRAALLEAVIVHADASVPTPKIDLDAADIGPMIRVFFEHRAAVVTKLGPIADSNLTWETRKTVTVPRRRAYVATVIDRWAPGLREPERTWLSDILVVLISSNTATAFREYVDCDAGQTADRVIWILDALRAQAKKLTRSRR